MRTRITCPPYDGNPGNLTPIWTSTRPLIQDVLQLLDPGHGNSYIKIDQLLGSFTVQLPSRTGSSSGMMSSSSPPLLASEPTGSEAAPSEGAPQTIVALRPSYLAPQLAEMAIPHTVRILLRSSSHMNCQDQQQAHVHVARSETCTACMHHDQKAAGERMGARFLFEISLARASNPARSMLVHHTKCTELPITYVY